MRSLIFVTHAQVMIDPDVPVPDWGLSQGGRARHEAFSARCRGVTAIYCSGERKAVEGADILAHYLRLPVQIIDSLRENDRSATGYLPGPEFEAMADAFFANPELSVRGWERAVDAQTRIVSALHEIVAEDRTGGDIAVIAHGGVGALFLAHLLGEPISRRHDQPGGGGGNVLHVALPGWRLVGSWVPMEESVA